MTVEGVYPAFNLIHIPLLNSFVSQIGYHWALDDVTLEVVRRLYEVCERRSLGTT